MISSNFLYRFACKHSQAPRLHHISFALSSPRSIASVSSFHSSNSTRRLLQPSFLPFFLLPLVNSMGFMRYSSDPNESTSLFFIIDAARPFRRCNSLAVKFRGDVFVFSLIVARVPISYHKTRVVPFARAPFSVSPRGLP